METRSRRSRWRFDGCDADAAPLTVTERDIAIFELLDPEHRYTYLPSHWVHAFIGGDRLRLSKRLGRLSRAPHHYLVRPPQRAQSVNALYKHDVYARAEAADRLLVARGLRAERARRPSEPYAHQLLNDLVDASIEIGVLTDPTLHLVTWRDILAHPKLPATTRASAQPFHIPLANATLIPDGRPFVIERTLPDGSTRFLCVLGKEIDRHTEPLTATDMERSSIARKLHHYRELFATRAYQSQFGFPNAVVLVISTNVQHLSNMMALTAKIIGPCSYLLFRHVPDWAHAPRFPSPSGDLLGSFARVQHPPFNLKTLGEP